MVSAAGAKSYFHTNRQGSVIAMSGDSAAKTEGPYTYDAYGNCFSGGSACGASGEPYRFTGRRLDPETGLYYYRARYYAPALGRFLQTDPVGYSADLNLYTYVGNDPTDKTDPTGRVTKCTTSTGSRIPVCTTTSDTFNAAHSNGQTTKQTATMEHAANGSVGAMSSPGPNAQPDQESAGVLHWNSPDNSTTVRPETGAKSGSTATGDTTTVTFYGPADVAGIHGHIDSGPKASNGMVDDPKSNNGYGDTASLALPHPRPMATVSHGQVGWHGIDNGRLYFTFPQGAMSPDQIQQMQQNLDTEQPNFQTP